MTMTGDKAMDPRSAQETLEAAFKDRPQGASDQPEDPAEDSHGQVTSMTNEEVDIADNPFAQATADHHILRQLEAVLFAASHSVSEEALGARIQGLDPDRHLAMLQKHYAQRGVNLRKIGEGWQFVSAPDLSGVLVEHRVQVRKLSRAALETLAIIAYHQPCSRADIEDVRGVSVAKGSLDQLLELGWIKLRGRRQTAPGRPVLYGTTLSFLEHFGLEALTDLPGLGDLKAAGLLDANLPPGFSVPTPKEGEEDDLHDETIEEEPAFQVDFTDEDES
ncbi:hypothetical protein PB2503_07132 [Parvularcula bermudensis HTCC2503]|uniref:Segregation and condensation protein B n=1 Tax=Parvularcula bermudensis (strain ATCC BAA-594 / HTCC2503 / KCTC 12087) TaxID=314260 RepID=E0TEB7_PARBH|nr:SMC-Scp complex subunit ScpB [Parvularcula bermudensis]ADM09492.1 hypothetical protein PB2503_07132 [Parvularcula bermudensis HTCC2503]